MPRTPKSPQRKTNGARPFRIGRSRTGLGAFATEPIKKRQFIAEYKGPLMTNKQCDETPENLYWFEVNARWTINGVARKNLARYINHSCRPNAEAIVTGGRIWIWSRRAIKAGEEITYNYGKEYFEAHIKPKGCGCVKCAG